MCDVLGRLSVTGMTSEEITCSCDNGTHHACDGYIAPLVYSNTKRCTCACHAGIFGRDFTRAMRRAEKSYYGRAYYPQPHPGRV